MNHERKYFFVRLNSPRPTFPADMTEEERSIMQNHIAYWTPYIDDGTMVVFGPVMDPKGTFGIAVLCVSDAEEADRLVKNDPATAIGTVDMYPMKAVTKTS